MVNRYEVDRWQKATESVRKRKKTNADWICQDCSHEWLEDDPFTRQGHCPMCKSDFIQHH